ncbi:hypothetical protein H6G54_08205 [Anabaena cylindrica FACHB-243]|uniref:Uncharacterized protein n=1 Tax=Anabaena cylindrica (strain ATCC 27899 / PCC 7122) TaxID=272123 RepID=K9ZNA1_ANACC|nr:MULTISPECIES: DUF6516 family protein [Anabaena]AFZ60259.1 hypothetical protein Anacy_4919 [Anabaena cylindrica PCC 7122]MBD2417688.1 hypothetical protein [Anabaena cylindrica FACHB-243]MBY5281265.1 hypothetical protein [Anabaena sp. CCAP 1446/1C]MBY5306651.1 hypothetical protein [Anabaena sp. CCAP 1446/1C]MCM2404603.1 DUF6516 family protein [Anabaena sp. CCAP 1446/1C]
MSESPLKSLAEYSQFVSQILNRSDVERSTLVLWSNSPYTGTAEGEVFFKGNIKLRMREELDFDAELITSYGYEVYRNNEKLYWYDDFPHPKDASLASTFPHHKHVPPEMKRNRIPAPNISFIHPNLPFLIQEIEALIQ